MSTLAYGDRVTVLTPTGERTGTYVQRQVGKLAHGERPTLYTVAAGGRTHTGAYVSATVLDWADRRAALVAADRPTLVTQARAMGRGKRWTDEPKVMGQWN